MAVECALEHRLFSHDEATLYERVSVRRLVHWLVRPLVTLSFFSLLGATNAVYTAPLLVFVGNRYMILVVCAHP